MRDGMHHGAYPLVFRLYVPDEGAPASTACYYAAAVLFLLMLAAFWCTEWLLGAVFAVLFLVCATLPHNMRIQYFNKRADKLENSFGKVVSVDLSEEDNLTLTISAPDQAESDGAAVPNVRRLPRGFPRRYATRTPALSRYHIKISTGLTSAATASISSQ